MSQAKASPPLGTVSPIINRDHSNSFKITAIFALICLAFFAHWVLFSTRPFPLPLKIHRKSALKIAKEALQSSGVSLSPSWEAHALASFDIQEDDLFIWKTEGRDRYYQLLGTYLTPPIWVVRFFRFDTPVAERAEEYQVYLAKDGEVIRIRHELPEARAGQSLSLEEARKVALNFIQNRYHLEPTKLKEVSSIASQLPNRKDWLIIYSDPSVILKTGEARIGIRISGNEVASSLRFVFVPEDWSRQERNRANLINLFKTFSMLPVLLALVGILLYAVIRWTQNRFSPSTFFRTFFLLTLLDLLITANQYPIFLGKLSTTDPKNHQWIEWIGLSTV
jgi:hypothetical protein